MQLSRSPAEVHGRGADAVDLDFEPIAPGQSANLHRFRPDAPGSAGRAASGLRADLLRNPATRAHTDLANLLAPGAADAVFIMGYNFRGGTPATTGSIDPLTSQRSTTSPSAVDAFTAQVDPSKVILGLPWYGEPGPPARAPPSMRPRAT